MNVFKKTAMILTAVSSLAVYALGFMPINSDMPTVFTANAAEIIESGECGAEGDNITWTLDSDGTLTISGEGEMMDWHYNSPWKERDDIINVIIEDGVTNIENAAFNKCEALTSIAIPHSVTSIGDWAFEECKALTSITIPDGVTSIGNNAFSDCTALSSVTIPKSVTNIGNDFYDTPWLKAQRQINPLVIVNDILIDGTACTGDVVIPDGVKSIGRSAFIGCHGLTSVTIPASVKSIEKWAFYECKALTSIAIPDSVKSIGEEIFSECTALTAIEIPDSITNMDFFTFYNTPWLEAQKEKNPLVIVNGILICGDTCKGDVVIPDDVTHIGEWAFEEGSDITSVTIPDSVTSIGDYAFDECIAMTSVTIPESITSIGESAFHDCYALTSITIPESVTTIEEDTFWGCNALISMTIPENVTNMDISAFNSCDALKSITIYNPECEITGYCLPALDTLEIYGYTGSTAEAYATKHKHYTSFVPLDEASEISTAKTKDKKSSGKNIVPIIVIGAFVCIGAAPFIIFMKKKISNKADY